MNKKAAQQNTIHLSTFFGRDIFAISKILRTISSSWGDIDFSELDEKNPTLNLSPLQTAALATVADELLGNVRYGLIRKAKMDEISKSVEQMIANKAAIEQGRLMEEAYDEGFMRAAELRHQSPSVQLMISVTPEGIGKVEVTHPIIPGLTPIFDKEVAISRRRSEGEQEIVLRGVQGGIFSIEQGTIHRRIEAAGLTHGEVMIQDIPVNHLQPFGDRIRSSSINFQRK